MVRNPGKEHRAGSCTTVNFLSAKSALDEQKHVGAVMTDLSRAFDCLLRWFIGDFTLTPQYFESSLSVNCHDSHFHRLPTISLNRVCH